MPPADPRHPFRLPYALTQQHLRQQPLQHSGNITGNTGKERMTDDTSNTPPEQPLDALLGGAEVDLGDFDPWQVGNSLGMSPKQIRYGIGLLSGKSDYLAAQAAGYTQTGQDLRSGASKAKRTKQMQAFLQRAKDYKAGVVDRPLSQEERRRILAKGARGGNEQLAVRAVLADHEIAQSEPKDNILGDPRDTLLELIVLDPKMGAQLAGDSGIALDDLKLSPEIKSEAAAHQARIARTWIRDNPRQAREIAHLWLQSSNGIALHDIIKPNGRTHP